MLLFIWVLLCKTFELKDGVLCLCHDCIITPLPSGKILPLDAFHSGSLCSHQTIKKKEATNSGSVSLRQSTALLKSNFRHVWTLQTQLSNEKGQNQYPQIKRQSCTKRVSSQQSHTFRSRILQAKRARHSNKILCKFNANYLQVLQQ